MDMIIFSGQSNMQGQSNDIILKDVVKNAYEYKLTSDRIEPLKDPAGENIRYDRKEYSEPSKPLTLYEWLDTYITGSACDNNASLLPSFCKRYIEITDNEVLAVHIAKGSTEIANWLPGTDGYNIIKEKSLAAISKCEKKIENIYFVWLQGESDAIKGNSREYYKESITLLCNELKKDIGISKFGIIRVGRFTNDKRDEEIISAQNEIVKENEDFIMLTDIATKLNNNPEYMNPFVKGHYNAKGLEALGVKASEALAGYTIKNRKF